MTTAIIEIFVNVNKYTQHAVYVMAGAVVFVAFILRR